MNFNEYQDRASGFAIYPGHDSEESNVSGLLYLTLGLCGEAGEVAEKVKKIMRDEGGILTHSNTHALMLECSDVLWYISELVNKLGYNLDQVADKNLEKLENRKENGKLGGSGDNR